LGKKEQQLKRLDGLRVKAYKIIDDPKKFKVSDPQVDAFIQDIIAKKDPFLHSELGANSFQMFIKKANAYQRLRAFQLLIKDPKFYLRNSKAFEYLISKYKRSITDMNTEEERMQAYHACKEYLKELMDEYTKNYAN
jgi:hypothetical protein